MYEGPIKALDHADGEASPILRQLRWSDLVARIAATRDQRGAEPHTAEELPSSFAGLRSGAVQNGQPLLNRDALTHGKITRLSRRETANNADRGDRETT